MADYQDTIEQIFDRFKQDRVAFLRDGPTEELLSTRGTAFANPGPAHAPIVISKLVTSTLRELVILTGRLSVRGHSALRMEAHLRRNPKVRIRVLAEGNPDGPIRPDASIDWKALEGSALADLLADAQLGQTDVVSFDGEASDGRIAVRILPTVAPLHFIVSDQFSYRIEPDHKLGKAVVNAKDIEKSMKLFSDFEKLWERSRPADLSQFTPSALSSATRASAA